ncbi:MAG: methyltransferase [Albidovulum sp.]
MFGANELTEDGFLGGRLRISQPRDGYRAAMDPVLLAAAVPARAGDTVLELGCGAGVASLCLASRVPGLALTGLELQSGYAALARANATVNQIMFTVEEGDLEAMPLSIRAQSFDHVIANPPYYPIGGGTRATDKGREMALREALPLAKWVDAGLKRLKPGGWLTFIQAADRLGDLLSALPAKAGSTVVLPLTSRQGRDANRVIMRARKGARGAFRLAAPVILHDGQMHSSDGDDYSAIARSVLRDGEALFF